MWGTGVAGLFVLAGQARWVGLAVLAVAAVGFARWVRARGTDVGVQDTDPAPDPASTGASRADL